MKVRMEIKGLVVDPNTDLPIVILKGAEGSMILPIWVGVPEANAIALKMEDVATPRPMTHDLLKSIIGQLDATLHEITVCDLKDNTFYARLTLRRNGEVIEVDSRPSDAIALALRTGSPIFVEESVLEQAKHLDISEEDSEEKVRAWLEALDPDEMGDYEM